METKITKLKPDVANSNGGTVSLAGTLQIQRPGSRCRRNTVHVRDRLLQYLYEMVTTTTTTKYSLSYPR
jgi:hypothetical protein